jgi:hypothetical protein
LASDHFDHLLRTLAAASSRRTTLRALGALALGLAAVPARESAAKSCGPCEKRKRGKCRRKKDGATCNGTGFCRRGVCQVCGSVSAQCSGGGDCCSGICQVELGHQFGTCPPGDAGAPCRTDADCTSGSCRHATCR